MTLRIGMVARCLNTEHLRGMGKYVYELLRKPCIAGPARDARVQSAAAWGQR